MPRYLAINSSSGAVKLTANPDFEAKEGYTFTVVATDAANNSSEKAVTLGINDVDDIPPTISAVSIPNTAMNVGDAVTVTITASETGLSLVSGTINGVAVTGFTDNNDNTYTATYTVAEGNTDIAAGSDIPVSMVLADAAGNNSTAFTTAISQNSDAIDANTPTLSSSTPTDDSSEVAVTDNIVLTFSEDLLASTGEFHIYSTAGDTLIESIAASDAKVTISGTSVTINPSNDLSDATEYYVLIDSEALTDTAGNAYVGISSTTALSFTTVAAATSSATTYAIVVESSGVWIDDNADGVKDAGETTAFTNSGEYTLAEDTVTIEFNDMPDTPLNLNGFGSDDKIEIDVTAFVSNTAVFDFAASEFTNHEGYATSGSYASFYWILTTPNTALAGLSIADYSTTIAQKDQIRYTGFQSGTAIKTSGVLGTWTTASNLLDPANGDPRAYIDLVNIPTGSAASTDSNAVVTSAGIFLDVNANGEKDSGDEAIADVSTWLAGGARTIQFDDAPTTAIDITGFGAEDKIEIDVTSVLTNEIGFYSIGESTFYTSKKSAGTLAWMYESTGNFAGMAFGYANNNFLYFHNQRDGASSYQIFANWTDTSVNVFDTAIYNTAQTSVPAIYEAMFAPISLVNQPIAVAAYTGANAV